MKVDRLLRIVLGFVIVLAFLLALAATLFVTESAMNVWDRLRAGPAWFLYAYVTAVVALALGTAWLVWRYVIPRRRQPERPEAPVFVTREALERDLAAAEAAGVDTGAARAELERLTGASRTLGVVLFGEISAGKSSLIRALLPGADVEVSPVGGSTTGVRRFDWQSPAGVEVRLLDVPGIGGVESYDAVVRDEAAHAHLVVFVCDDDLTRRETEALGELIATGKPVVVALNKSDRYSRDELDVVLARIHERTLELAPDGRAAVVPVVAGGAEAVIEIDAAGREQTRERTREPEVGQLVAALNSFAREDPAVLDTLRERAVFRLAGDKLRAEQTRFRQRRSEEIVRAYTRKAVVGALAAISPGTDIAIQGYLGTGLTRELCRLYGQAPRDLDVEEFLNLSQSRVGKALPLTMAVAGNGLKAFPGIGTVAGGLVHAVAYGLIFDALGRSLAQALAARKGFSAKAAAASFEQSLNDRLEARVGRIAALALKHRKADDEAR